MKTDKQVNRLITIVMIIIFIIIAIIINASAQNYGYRIVIEIGNKTPIVREARNTENLKKVVDLYFPKSDIDINEFMKASVYFEIRRYQHIFNVETMRVDKKGKLRKLRRKEIKIIENDR